MKTLLSYMMAFAFLLPAVVPLRAVANGRAVADPVSDLQEAAFNYEYAAEAQVASAEETLVQARYLRDTVLEDAVKARRAKVQAGNLQLRAADLLLAAAGNLEHASRVWRLAASAAGSESAAGQYFKSASQAASARVLGLVREAVELCEQAALGFAAESELLSQAAANQKAAGLRERLAKR